MYGLGLTARRTRNRSSPSPSKGAEKRWDKTIWKQSPAAMCSFAASTDSMNLSCDVWAFSGTSALAPTSPNAADAHPRRRRSSTSSMRDAASARSASGSPLGRTGAITCITRRAWSKAITIDVNMNTASGRPSWSQGCRGTVASKLAAAS